MTTTKAEELAARLESGWCPIESPGDMQQAAAELRRLAAVEAERDDLKLAFAHTVRLVQDWKQSAYAMEAERDAMRLDYSRLLEKHNNLHANAARDRAERDALLADAERYRWLRQGDNDEQVIRFHEWATEVCVDPTPMYLPRLERLDKLIDAAMKGTT